MRIDQLANIQTGFQFRERVVPDPDGTMGVIQIKDIPDRRRLNPDSIDRIAFDKPHSEYRVGPGDVLFLSRGHKQFGVAIEHNLGDTIASGYFFIVRPDRSVVRPDFLSWYLNQPPMQEKFKQLAKGTHMPFVSMAEFRELEIPLPPLAVQERVVALSALSEHEQSLLTQIAEMRAQIVQSACISAATRTCR